MLRVHVGLAVALALGIGAARPHAGPSQTAPDTSTRAVAAAARTYVAEYTKTFEFLLADEDYEQIQFSADNKEIARRVMRSELFLTYLPGDRTWIAIRDAVEVDDTPVPEHGDVRKLLTGSGDARGLLPKLIARNARHNIGRIERNFNEPTLPLLLFDPKRADDVRFERTQVVRVGDNVLVTLAFEERDRRGLIRGPLGPVAAKGEIVVEAGTGVIRRTTFDVSASGVRGLLITDYEHHERLDLWLPARFTETYERSGPMRERVTGEATYSNYRRFEVSVRIK